MIGHTAKTECQLCDTERLCKVPHLQANGPLTVMTVNTPTPPAAAPWAPCATCLHTSSDSGLANFFCKHFRLRGLSCHHSALPLYHKGSQGAHVSKWVWLQPSHLYL